MHTCKLLTYTSSLCSTPRALYVLFLINLFGCDIHLRLQHRSDIDEKARAKAEFQREYLAKHLKQDFGLN